MSEDHVLRRQVRNLQFTVAGLMAVQRASVAGQEAIGYALTHGVYPVLHDGEHAEFADQFQVYREEMNAVKVGLQDGSIGSSMAVERMIDHHRAPNFKIVAGFVLRYFFLSNLDIRGRDWSDIGLTGDAASAFKPFDPSEITVA